MATYRQLQESLGIHEGIVKSKKEARPGDIWKPDSGNWYGLRKDKDTGEEESQSYGPEGKDKAKVYAAGGDPDKEDDSEKDEKKPKPKKTITCSSCGQTGHNKTSKKCPNVIDA